MATSMSCGAYSCGGTTCKTSCTSMSDCAPTHYCAGSGCAPRKINGEVCAGSSECTSGTCGGRCCASACKCKQPGAANLVKNPGFDADSSKWETFLLDGGTRRDAWTNADAEGCPYSGSYRITAQNHDDLYLRQCVALPLGRVYRFGLRVRQNTRGNTISIAECKLYFKKSPTDCAFIRDSFVPWAAYISLAVGDDPTGWTSREADTDPVADPTATHALIECHVLNDSDSPLTYDIDMVYLSPAPGGY